MPVACRLERATGNGQRAFDHAAVFVSVPISRGVKNGK